MRVQVTGGVGSRCVLSVCSPISGGRGWRAVPKVCGLCGAPMELGGPAPRYHMCRECEERVAAEVTTPLFGDREDQ